MAIKFLPIVVGFAFVMPVINVAFAANPQTAPSKDDIINALVSKDSSTSRGFVQAPSNAPAGASKSATRASYNSPAPTNAGAASAHASIGVPILFDFNSATIKPDSRSTLNEIAAALRSPNLKDAKILLEGHTDSSGRAEANLELSQLRADAVRDYLVGEGGVPRERLSTAGKGQAEPANPNNPMAPENRRVVLVNLSN